jgi:hypothetical protein
MNSGDVARDTSCVFRLHPVKVIFSVRAQSANFVSRWKNSNEFPTAKTCAETQAHHSSAGALRAQGGHFHVLS